MPKPTELPEWAESAAPADVVAPAVGKQAQGWVAPGGVGEAPAHNFFNWWQRAVGRWTKYLRDLEAEALVWTGFHQHQGNVELGGFTTVPAGGTAQIDGALIVNGVSQHDTLLVQNNISHSGGVFRANATPTEYVGGNPAFKIYLPGHQARVSLVGLGFSGAADADFGYVVEPFDITNLVSSRAHMTFGIATPPGSTPNDAAYRGVLVHTFGRKSLLSGIQINSQYGSGAVGSSNVEFAYDFLRLTPAASAVGVLPVSMLGAGVISATGSTAQNFVTTPTLGASAPQRTFEAGDSLVVGFSLKQINPSPGVKWSLWGVTLSGQRLSPY